MTVAQMIEALQKMPPNAEVVMKRSERIGYDSASMERTKVFRASGSYCEFGRFEAESLQHRNNIDAVVIS